MPKNTPESLYLNGVVKLHDDFEKSVRQALEVSLTYIPKETSYLKRVSNKLLSLQGRLLVDFSKEQPQNALKGYFIFGGKNSVVHRFLTVIIEYPFFFPIIDYSQDIELNKGVKYSDIKRLITAKNPVVISYKPIGSISDKITLFTTTVHTNIENKIIAPKDDVGMPFCLFKDIDELWLKDIPATLLKREYTAVGINYYAPYSTNEESYCVLFAQLDNPYDDHAIKLLRWFPQDRNSCFPQDKCFWGDVFYEMGYISRNENTELHQFMTDNKSRILFGKKTGNKIVLLGGVKIFLGGSFNYPKCLSNIDVR